MLIQAAVVHDRGASFQIETVELTDPAPDELIVRDLIEVPGRVRVCVTARDC